MIVESVKYFPFSIKLKKPFQNSQFTITHREGFYLEIKTSESEILFGEASPLPGFSKENMTIVESELKAFSMYVEKNKALDRTKVFNWINQNNISPSTAYAIEQALFDYKESKSSMSLEVNGLVGGGSFEQVIERTDTLVASGYKTIKLKLGVNSFEDDLMKLNAINKSSPNLNIRIDVNGKWSFDEALSKIERLDEFNIDYIEQPVSNLDDLIQLSAKTKIPLAADESIENHATAKKLLAESNLTLVIKPMTLGFINTVKLIQLANSNNKKIVISSLFESSIGRAGNIFLASLLECKTSHGLATAGFLEEEVYNDPYKITDGFIKFNADNISPKFEKAR